MQNKTNLQGDVLDIIFEGRNKEYGAYDLRRTYNKRLKVSIAVMLLVVLLFTAGQLIGGKGGDKPPELAVNIDVELAPPPEPEQPLPPPPPPPPPPPQPQVRTIQVTTPRIMPDDQVKPDEVLPEVDDMENARIDVVNRDGVDDLGEVGPPTAVPDGGKGLSDVPKENPDSIFISVQIESSYPGGPDKWQRFLYRHLRYPQEAQDNGIQGTVEVQFIVDRDGTVSEVHAISGPEELRPEAERVIKKSGKWVPAIQNGKNVKSYKRQPIGFKLYTD